MRLLPLLFMMFGLWIHQPARAADYPERPVRIIVAFSAGGSVDIVTRIIGEALSPRLGRPVIVENRTGAGGNIGAEYAARATPDGYTLFMGGAGSLGANAALYRNLPYDPVRDFAAIALIGLQPNLVVVHPALPVHSMQELVDYARANPGKLSYGSAGPGSAEHMAGELFRRQADLDMIHVPYRGAAPALSDLIAGHVQVMFETTPTLVEPLRANQLRALAATTERRLATMPDLPTVAETVLPGYVSRGYIGLVAPTGTPPAIINRLNREVREILRDPAISTRLTTMGLELMSTSPEKAASFLRAEVEAYRRLVATTGITLD